MTPTRILLFVAPAALMLMPLLGLGGIEQWTASLGSTSDARLILGRIGIALPYAAAAAIGIVFLFAARGALSIRSSGTGALAGAVAVERKRRRTARSASSPFPSPSFPHLHGWPQRC